jgi:hypothetical protein
LTVRSASFLPTKNAAVAEMSRPRVNVFGTADAIFMIAVQSKTLNIAENAKNSLATRSKNGLPEKILKEYRI